MVRTPRNRMPQISATHMPDNDAMDDTKDRHKAPAIETARDEQEQGPPRQPRFGFSENYGSPGGDEPLPGDDPGRGSATEARERT